MASWLKIGLPRTCAPAVVAALFALSFVHARQARAQDFVPGSGRRVMEVGDDFEDLKWNYIANLPKSSENIDHQARLPGGVSANGRWFEPQMRGAPDIVRLVQTPAGGIPGSKGSMLMQTLWSGVPGRASFKPQQDDFIADVASKIGLIPISRRPSVVVRVYLPPFDKWEKRTGNSFGYRACIHTTKSNARIFGAATKRRATSSGPACSSASIATSIPARRKIRPSSSSAPIKWARMSPARESRKATAGTRWACRSVRMAR